MKRIVKLIIIALVGLFFVLSACEINTSYFSNTFDDDYDYYIQPDNTQTTNITFNTDAYFTFIIIPDVYVFTSAKISTFFLLKPHSSQYYSSPLYLKNLVLLI